VLEGRLKNSKELTQCPEETEKEIEDLWEICDEK
jgi:hypothetical protein